MVSPARSGWHSQNSHWNSGDERASCGDTCEGWGEFSVLICQRAEEKTSERLTESALELGSMWHKWVGHSIMV